MTALRIVLLIILLAYGLPVVVVIAAAVFRGMAIRTADSHAGRRAAMASGRHPAGRTRRVVDPHFGVPDCECDAVQPLGSPSRIDMDTYEALFAAPARGEVQR